MMILALAGVAGAGFLFLFPNEALVWIGRIRKFLAAVQLRYLHLVREHAYQAEQDRQELAHVGRTLSAMRRRLMRLPTTETHAKKRQTIEQHLAAVEQRLKAVQQKKG